MATLTILLFVPVLVVVLLILNPLVTSSPVGKRSWRSQYNDKVSPYECGFTPILGQVRAPITISFYLVSILYLVFDLEIALMIPIVAGLNSLGVSAYLATILFIAILTAGFVFEIGSGALKWTND